MKLYTLVYVEVRNLRFYVSDIMEYSIAREK